MCSWPSIKVLLLVFLLLVPFASKAQNCLPFDSLGAREGVELSELEDRFSGNEGGSREELKRTPVLPEGTASAYQDLVKGLGDHLADAEGFDWNAPVSYFQRIYFEPNGKAAYYLYQFRSNGFTGCDRGRFESLVEEYLKENRLSVSKEERFAVCAPVILRPPQE